MTSQNVLKHLDCDSFVFKNHDVSIHRFLATSRLQNDH